MFIYELKLIDGEYLKIRGLFNYLRIMKTWRKR